MLPTKAQPQSKQRQTPFGLRLRTQAKPTHVAVEESRNLNDPFGAAKRYQAHQIETTAKGEFTYSTRLPLHINDGDVLKVSAELVSNRKEQFVAKRELSQADSGQIILCTLKGAGKSGEHTLHQGVYNRHGQLKEADVFSAVITSHVSKPPRAKRSPWWGRLQTIISALF